ncbi:hypothetical protein [Streptomyces sp. NPDC093598]|uniref:hypothetical protein n=1 Tax=Streptomyces sp. NPDC093598 TaxID=3366046 RepID=UPI0038154FD6
MVQRGPNSEMVGRYQPRLLLRIGLAAMLAASTAALLVSLAGQLNRVLALGLAGTAFLGVGQVFGTASVAARSSAPPRRSPSSGSRTRPEPARPYSEPCRASWAAVASPLAGPGGEDDGWAGV